MAAKRSQQPIRKGTAAPFSAPSAQNPNKSTPRFCLRHLQPGYDVHSLEKDQKADLATALQKRARMTWEEILFAPKHGLGSELMPKSQLKVGIPPELEDRDSFLVLRYSGKLPMVGFRSNDTFHLVWIEAEFGTIYDH